MSRRFPAVLLLALAGSALAPAVARADGPSCGHVTRACGHRARSHGHCIHTGGYRGHGTALIRPILVVREAFVPCEIRRASAHPVCGGPAPTIVVDILVTDESAYTLYRMVEPPDLDLSVDLTDAELDDLPDGNEVTG